MTPSREAPARLRSLLIFATFAGGCSSKPAPPPLVRSACDEVATSWRAVPNVRTRLIADTVFDVPGNAEDTTPVKACEVIADDPAGLAPSDSARINRDGPAKSAYWRTHAQSGWSHLVHIQFDGTDGSATAYQRDPVRCYVDEAWDGGDAMDTTYVPPPWYRETTSCWWHRQSIDP